MKPLNDQKFRTPIKLAGIYMVFGCLWILISDKLLHSLSDEEQILHGIQTFKGTLYVLLSSLLIFIMVRYEIGRREKTEMQLMQMEKRTKEEAVKASEAERNRISKELHDGIQQELAGISMMIERIKSEGDVKDLEELKEEVQTCIEETRSISHSLSSFQLEKRGLKEALKKLSISNSNGDPVTLNLRLDCLEERTMSYFTAINIYRIVQELLLNVSKHSTADRIDIAIEVRDTDRYIFRYFENAPRSQQRNTEGFGMQSIQNRIDCLHGELLDFPQGNAPRQKIAFTFSDLHPKETLSEAKGAMHMN